MRSTVGSMLTRTRCASTLAVMLALAAVAAPAAGQDEKAILVLHTFGYDAPGRAPSDLALARAMRQAGDVKVDLYVETLDPNRFRGDEQARRTREYLREKYADKKIAVLVA